MAQGLAPDVMADAALLHQLAEVAKDTALLQGVQMRIQESPKSSEVTALGAAPRGGRARQRGEQTKAAACPLTSGICSLWDGFGAASAGHLQGCF